MSESTDLVNVTAPVSSAEVDAIAKDFGEDSSAEGFIRTADFARGDLTLQNALMKISDTEKLNTMCFYLQGAHLSTQAGAQWKPFKVNMIKKIDPMKPDQRMGMLEVENRTKIEKEITFLPLISYPTRAYWEPYGTLVNGKKAPAICMSVNNFQGLFRTPTPHIVECEGCNFKEWGCDREGVITRGAKGSKQTKPLCVPHVNFIGVTPEFDGIYELELKSYCLSKAVGADQKLKTGSRMLLSSLPDFETDETLRNKYNGIQKARIDSSSKWLKLSGAIKMDGASAVSATTVVEYTQKVLTDEERIMVMIYGKFATAYVHNMMRSFKNRLLSQSGAGDATVIDTEFSKVDESSEAEYTDSLDEK